MNDFNFNPQISNLQTQMQQLQALMGKAPPTVPSPPPHTIPEVDGIEGARQFQKTMPPNSKDAVFDKVEPVFFALGQAAGTAAVMAGEGGCAVQDVDYAALASRLAADGIREAVYKRFKEIGFLYVTLDMHGYKLGSMNATL